MFLSNNRHRKNIFRALIGVIRGVTDIVPEEEAVRQISIPICSIVVGRDPLKAFAETMVSRNPKTTSVVIEGADHITTPGRGETIEALRSFLNEHRF